MRAVLWVLVLQVWALVVFLALFTVAVTVRRLASWLRRPRPGSRSGGLRG